MTTLKAGKFELELWLGGHPIWCHLTIGGEQAKSFSHGDLADLRHVIDRAIAAAKQALPDRYKGEVD